MRKVRYLILIDATEIKCRTRKLAEELAMLVGGQVIERHQYRLWRPGQGFVKEETSDVIYTPTRLQ